MPNENLKIVQSYSEGGTDATDAIITKDVKTDIVKKLNSSLKTSAKIYSGVQGNPTGKNVVDWCRKIEELGAGEILLTSMDKDGTKDGYDNKLNKIVSSSLNIPLIASGGAGPLKHMIEGILQGGAEAILAASVFHFSKYSIKEVKLAFAKAGINVRPIGG